MAEPVVRVEPARVAVEPGGQAVVTVTVLNPGTVVEGYDVDVVSTGPLPWATVTPATLSVYPQQQETVSVTFAPPRGPDAPDGTVPFGVRVRSQVDPMRSAVAEGDLEVATVSGLQAELTPVTSSGRWSAGHRLRVANHGNGTARLGVVASDPDEALGFLVSPATLELPPAGHGYARVKVRTRHPMLRGAARRLPFTVVCEPDAPSEPASPGLGQLAVSTPDRPVVNGTFHQRPILDRWVVLAAGLLVAALVALVVWAVGRDDPQPAGDGSTPASPDQPTGLRATAVDPDIMVLTWDRVDTATAYKVQLTEPASDEFPTPGQQVQGFPGRLQFRMVTDRAARHCYVVVAVREGASDSVPSEQVCADSVAEAGDPEPTDAPGIVPAPGHETPAPGVPTEPTPPPGGTDPTSPDTSPTGPAPAFLTVLKPYDAGNTQAELDLQAAQDAGLTDVRLGSAEELGLELAGGLARVLYVEGTDEASARRACQAVLASAPELVTTGCLETFTHPLPEGGAPAASASPVAAPSP